MTEENVPLWLGETGLSKIWYWIGGVQIETEKESGFRRRTTALREFTKYLYAISVSEYIFSTNYNQSVKKTQN